MLLYGCKLITMKRFLAILIFLTGTISMYSQNLDSLWATYFENNKVPKIGLALSGGAAHGLAHVGVIKYLEEIGVPVDYITGTSMGAIVGGLYAMGYDYQSMIDIIASENWDAIVSNSISLNEISPYEKQFHNKIPVKLRVEKSKILLPKALFDGHKLDLAISNLFSPSNLVESFDGLPRPFRCYAVDLINGNIVELDSGNLGQAVRASMAIPSVFTPVQIDSMLLVDGGLLKNFPVQENLDLGSDIVIGVYVGSKKSKIEDVNSMLEILRLTGFISSIADTEEQKLKAQILIEPDVKDYPLLDFEHFEMLVEKGYEAARKDSVRLLDLANYFKNIPEKKIMPLKLPQRFFIEDIIINQEDEAYSKLIISRLDTINRKQVRFSDISHAIENCFATNNIDNINFSLKDGALGEILEINYKEKKENSIGVSANHFSNTNTSLIFQGTLRNVFAPMSNLTGYGRLSDNPGIMGLFYQRLGTHRDYLLEVGGSIYRQKEPIKVDQELRKELLFNRFRMHLGLSKELGRKGLISLHYGFNNRSLKPQLLMNDDIDDYDQNLQDLSLVLSSNSYNDWSLPNSGNQLWFKASFLHNVQQELSFVGDGQNQLGIPSAQSNLMLNIVYKHYTRLNSSVRLFYAVSGGMYIEESLFDVFRIGGTDNEDITSLPFIGVDLADLRYQSYVYGRAGASLELSDNIFISLIANVVRGQTYNPKFIDIQSDPKWESKLGLGISMSMATLIGPLNIDIGSTEGFSELTFSVGVGYRFIQ